jgi:hypothetical protein
VTGLALTAQTWWILLGYSPERQRGGAVTSDASDSLASAMANARNGRVDAYRLLLRRCVAIIDLTAHCLTMAGLILINGEFGQRFLGGTRFSGGESHSH